MEESEAFSSHIPIAQKTEDMDFLKFTFGRGVIYAENTQSEEVSAYVECLGGGDLMEFEGTDPYVLSSEPQLLALGGDSSRLCVVSWVRRVEEQDVQSECGGRMLGVERGVQQMVGFFVIYSPNTSDWRKGARRFEYDHLVRYSTMYKVSDDDAIKFAKRWKTLLIE